MYAQYSINSIIDQSCQKFALSLLQISGIRMPMKIVEGITEGCKGRRVTSQKEEAEFPP